MRMYDRTAMATKIQSRHVGTKDTKVGTLMAENFVIFVSTLENICKGRVPPPGFRHTRESGYPG